MNVTFPTRRDMLQSLVAVFGATISGCTPLRVGLHLYPDDFDKDASRVDVVLRAFVASVVPGVDIHHHNLVRHFYDEDYPLASCRNFVAAELCSSSLREFGTDRFPQLTQDQQTSVIQLLLDKGGTTRRIFTGAIFLTQIAVYAGIYDENAGCWLIDFEGTYRVRSLAELSYPDCDRFATHWITSNGNPA